MDIVVLSQAVNALSTSQVNEVGPDVVGIGRTWVHPK